MTARPFAALAILEKALAHDHRAVVRARLIVANIYLAQRRYQDALLLLERALASQEPTLGSEHPQVADNRMSLGRAYLGLGRVNDAEAQHRRALAIHEKVYGLAHYQVGVSGFFLAEVLRQRGKHAEAGPLYERNLMIAEKIMGKDAPALIYALSGVGEHYVAIGQPARALPHLERAIRVGEVLSTGGNSEPTVPKVRLQLAKVLISTGGERTRARALALQARDEFRAKGGVFATDAADAERWLVAHGGSQ